MEKQDILKFCMNNGFFLDRDLLNLFIELDNNEIERIINKLKSFNIQDSILTKKIFDKYKENLDIPLKNNEISENNVKILTNVVNNSEKIKNEDFISYFRVRFESLRDILIKKDLDNLTSIRRLGKNSGIFSIIGMIYNKRITKNKNLLIEIEDLTGRVVVLVNRENKQLFERAQNLLLDDVVAFKCSGSSKMLFASDFFYPDSYLEKENFGNKDEFVVFGGNFHVGSKFFLEKELIRFISWINGEIGDERQKILAKKVKYLILNGNNIEGVSVYSGQEKFLEIKGCRNQYKKLAEILDKIRKDVEIIISPGFHDAVWEGEPQSAINKKWGSNLNNLNNLRFVSNPSVVEIGGLKILIYSGGSINGFINEISGIKAKYGKQYPIKIAEKILKRRHLAPIYGKMDIIPNKTEDRLVLKELPDVFIVGAQCQAMVGNYNNILIVSSSCWSSLNNFEKKINIKSNPCKVPILNLKSKEVKILDFLSDKVELNEEKNLFCDLKEGDK